MRLSAAFTAVCSVALVLMAAAAHADVKQSANWSGFAVHRSGVRFKRVSGTWTVPSASCVPGQRTFSSFWIGLGGYSLSSPALEQIGTDVNCTRSGTVRSSAWYELVPARSHTISVKVRPGDRVSGTVVVVGHQATLSLTDETTRRSFKKTVRVGTVDVSSAEWIVEAPSLCGLAGSCQILPLADFGRATFSRASALTTSGRRGTISSPVWRSTKLRLTPDGTQFVVAQGAGMSGGEATPSRLSANGSRFSVSYLRTSQAAAVSMRARQAPLSDGHVVH